MGEMQKIDRRQFLIGVSAVGGGMALGILPSREAEAASADASPWIESRAAGSVEFTPWIAIAPDDTVTIQIATPEIGNGTMTQCAANVVEELQCDWAKVRTEFAPVARDYRENAVYSTIQGPTAYFSGRSTAAERMKLLLQVGASARERLKAAAAAEWKVPVAEITAADSVLTHTKSGRKLRYGEIAAKAADVKLDAEPKLKPESEWTFLGKRSPAKLNIPEIVNGSAVYGMDVRVPGMVYAALRQCPVHGGKLKSFDDSVVKKMPGVIAVVSVDRSETPGSPVKGAPTFDINQTQVQSAVAVVAEHYWQARKALDALPVEWDDGAGAHWKSTDQMYEAAVAALDGPAPDGKPEKATGDVSGIDKQHKLVEAVYVTPFSDQSCMEPLNGTALVTPERVDVWHPAQHSKQAFWITCDETGMPPEKVFFHQTYVGGGFGRRIFADDLRMVVAVARKVPGRPVHVIWSREEMMRQGRYRPMVAAKLRAGLGEDGLPKIFTARQATKGHFPRFADTPYALGCIPNVLVDAKELPIHVLTGAYRGPGYNSYAFMLETFIDECAHAAGIDPVEYRRKLLSAWPDKGWIKTLDEATSKAGWGQSLPRGMGQGVAIANWGNNGKAFEGTTVCVVATVEVTRKGNLKVHQLDAAFDTGRIVNRDAVLNEMEGGLIFGLNMALNEEINVKNGRIVEGNFDQYPILRTGDTPKINVHFGGLSGHDRFSEIGEPPAGPVGPAVGNAIFRAIGKRIRSTPIRKHDLSWA
jgi:isoquinoline 1-oxidoreductase beta subunit